MDSGSQTQQRDALSEGRRIYVGNLLYSIKPADVEDLMRQTGFDQSFEQLHISIDPVSGRNPGYCFVEFTTREEADRALEVLAGASLFNRAIKVGPCNPKSSSQRESRWNSSRGDDYKPTFQRWGDWKGGEDSQSGRREGEQGPQGAARHLDDRSRRNPDKAQLYIGGLGMMTDQEHHDTEMQELLAGFDVYVTQHRFQVIPPNFASCENSPKYLVSRLASVSLPALRRGRSPAITIIALWTSAPLRRLNGR